MRYPGFVGGSAQSLNPLASLQGTMNFYTEVVRGRKTYYPVEGTTIFGTTTHVGNRASFEENGRAFSVHANQLVEWFADGSTIDRGFVTQDDNPATICSNGTTGGQLFITSGTNGYCYVLATNTLTLVLAGVAVQGAMLDGFFLAFNPVNGEVRFSALNDGTSWDPLDFFFRSIAPDPWRAMIVSQGKIWMIGEHTGEVWWDAGGADVPFEPIQSSVFSYGIIAPFSLIGVGDSVRWLSQTKDGDGIVVGARGYRPERLSDHPTETAIAAYKRAARITDCEALTYQTVGHTFTSLRFPAANATRCFDDATGEWHQRGLWNSGLNQFDIWRPRMHMAAFGKHLVGDPDTGVLAELDGSYLTEYDGLAIRRQLIPPALFGENDFVQVDRLELYLQQGLAPQSPALGSAPVVELRVSGNAGKTFGNARHGAAGSTGEYDARLTWVACGAGQTWVPKFTFTDPLPWRVCDCFVVGTGFSQAAA